MWQFYYFLSNLDIFYFSSLIANTGTLSIMLKKSGKDGHPRLVPILRGKAFSFTLWSLIGVGVSYRLFLCLGVFYLYRLCLEFLWVDVEFCQIRFLHLLRLSWFLSFILLMWCVTSIDLQMLDHPWSPGTNLTWFWCMILLMCCWIQFASILLKIFYTYVHEKYQPAIFFVVSLSGFNIRVMLVL